jgi:hypothetical protein
MHDETRAVGHRDVLQRLGMMPKSAPHRSEPEVLDNGVLLF